MEIDYLVKILLSAFCFLLCASSFAAEKSILELSLTLNKKGDSHMVDGSKVVAAFKKNGVVNEKPDSYDYADYYTLQKDYDFLGAKLIAFEYEHIEKYIGCCVNPGSAVILLPKGSVAQIEEFSKNNKCHIFKGKDIFYVPDDALHIGGLSLTKSSLIELSCKENDMNRDD